MMSNIISHHVMPIKTTLRFHLIWVRMIMIKNLQMKNTGEDVREEETLFTVDRGANWCIHYGNQCGDPSENKQQEWHLT